jgi:hypothetical protein
MTDGYGEGPHAGPPNGGYNGSGDGDMYGQKRMREDEYGPNKRMAREGPSGPETVYRLLCDRSLVGGMIGKSGENIQAIQRNTGAFIQAIQEAPPHCLERVIVISGSKEIQPGEQYNSAQKALFEMFETQLRIDRNTSGPVLRCVFRRVPKHPFALLMSLAQDFWSATSA